MARLRNLNVRGIQLFHDYLRILLSGATTQPPYHLLEDEQSSDGLEVDIQVEPIRFSNRLEAGRYLHETLAPLPSASVEHNAGLWNWLSLFYIDQLCPMEERRRGRLKDEHKYFLYPVKEPGHSRRYYRHLLAGPYTVYNLHCEAARLLLSGRVDEFSDLNEQFAARQEFITNTAILKAADVLYFDEAKGQPKRGVSPNSRKPGTLRRYIDVLQQFDLTYDLYSLNSDQILGLLPSEFDRWGDRNGQVLGRGTAVAGR